MSSVQHIWIVDDDKLYTVLLTKTIFRLNKEIQITAFSNGEEALKELNKSEVQLPEIIFLDINMPVMDGWEFLKEYSSVKKNWDKKIKIYTVSSSISDFDIDKSNTYKDVIEYIVKPLKGDKVLEILGE